MGECKQQILNNKSQIPNNKSQIPDNTQPTTNLKLQTTNSKLQTTNPINRELQKDLQKQQRKLATLEADINKTTQDKLKLEEALGLPENYTDIKKFTAVENDYKKITSQLEQMNKEYEQLFEKVMELEAQVAG